jgi:hypothetical protein
MAATSTARASGLWTTSATWVGSGCGTGPQSGAVAGVVNGTGVVTPAVSPVWTVDALIGRKLLLGSTYYSITDNDETTCTISTPPATANYVWSLGGKPLAGDLVSIPQAYTVTCDEAISIGASTVLGELVIGAVTLTISGTLTIGSAAVQGRLTFGNSSILARGTQVLTLTNAKVTSTAVTATPASITGSGAIGITGLYSGRISNPRAIYV